MEWDNPYSDNFNWTSDLSYLPQRAMGNNDNEIGLIWNKSIGFQKFQRYAHGELELDDLLKYVRGHKNKNKRAYSIYGNDIEVFDLMDGKSVPDIKANLDRFFRSAKKGKSIVLIKER